LNLVDSELPFWNITAVEPAPQGASSTTGAQRDAGRRDDWLSPLELSEALQTAPVPVGRAPNTGCLPMSLDEYLQLLDWTGRQMRSDKRGAIPAELPPILDRLQIRSETWLTLITNFPRLFRRAAGHPAVLRQDAADRGRRPVGLHASEVLFG
jgi:hypothetical protein